MTAYLSGHPAPPPGSNGTPARDLSGLSLEQLTQIRDWAARLGASPVVSLTTLGHLEDLIDHATTLIINVGGHPPPVSTLVYETGLVDLERLPMQRLCEIRSLADKLQGSAAATPGLKTRLGQIIARTDHAITVRHEIEEYWAERGQPIPAHVTYQPPTPPSHPRPRTHKS